MTYKFIRLSLPLLFNFASLSCWAGMVDRIVVEGNLKTRDEIILQEMYIKPGDQLSDEKIKRSQQAIMDLGLFRKVNIEVEGEDNKHQLNVIVKEKKHDWYILPRLDRNGDGDITLGINWRENNLFGLNQSSALSFPANSLTMPVKIGKFALNGVLFIHA